jgi:uncharacterized repeat protein (TIGR01451 family)
MSGVALGTATITYVTPAGCYDTHTVNVTASCSGMPVAGTVSSGAGVVCAGTPVVLTLSGSTVACGISYQWQNSPDGTTWTNISGVTNTSLTDYPSATTYYRCAVTCASGGLTAYSTVASVVISYAIASHSIVPGPDTACNNAHFRLTMCSYASSLNVTTYYGDGSSDNVPVTYSSGIAADVFHNYTLPGTYTIKQVLYDGAAPQDSVTFAYEHLFCRTLPIKFYQDFNTNCAFDAGDNYNTTPVTMAVDSNGVTIDTIIVTSGMYRKAYGPPGTIYAFRVLAVSGGRVVACPSSAVLYDTISATVYTYPEKYFGIQCGSSTSFDLAENVTTFCGTTFASSTIYISNSYCTPASPVVTMHMSPRYHFLHATPAPASVSGNTITWNLPPVSTAAIPMRTISVVFVPTVTLVPGDTIHSDYQVTPLSGDVNTANNYIAMVNTIVTSYDPNDLEVSPAGKVLPCAQLQYRVRFENTGNDTARNIYVLDTLSPNIDPMSLNVVMASAAMNVSVINDGVRNIARFDFPHINLLDSSHHNQCQGMFIFSVKARSGLTFGSVINNKVGIYFDDNAVVGTNTVSNTIGMDTIAGPGIVCSGSSITLSNATTGGTWSITGSGAGIAGGVVTGISAGTATVSYTIANGCGSFRVTKIITVNSTPSGAAISGTATVCVGNTTSLSGTVAGGTWTSSNSSMAAVGSSGVVSGIASGNATISYAIANSCGSTVVTRVVTVNTLPSIAAISGMSSVCVGAVTTLYDITSGGVWSSTNTGVATMGAAGVVSGIAAGSTTISYTTGNACGMSAATVIITVNTPPSAGTISGSGVICPGAAATLSSAVPGGTWGSTNLSIATVSAGGVVSAVATGYVAITYTVVNSCGSASAMTIVTVNTSAASPIAGSLHLCTGTASGLSNAVPGGTWSSSNVAVATIGSVTGLATGLTTGTTTITYTQAGGCRITAVATVGLNPAAITGLTEVCSGRTITLANTVAGGIWSSSATSIAGIGSSSGIVTGVTSGTAMMTYTMPGGCASSAILSVLSSVMPAATVAASPAGPVCVGVPVSFSAIPVYGGSAPLLSWIVNGATAGAGTSYSYTPADGDHVVCRLISSMQCRIADTVFSDPASLEVYPAYTPVVTIATDPGIYVFPAQTVTLTALAVDAGVAPQYQWLLNGVVIPGATLVSYTSSSYSDKDSITCMVTGTGGCGIIGYKSVVMHVFPLSVSNTTTGTNIDIHPNPTSGMLTISGTVNNGADQEVAIEVTNMLGQVVYKRYITTKNDVVYEQVELSNTLPNGMYMLSLKTVGGSKVVHFVLEQK